MLMDKAEYSGDPVVLKSPLPSRSSRSRSTSSRVVECSSKPRSTNGKGYKMKKMTKPLHLELIVTLAVMISMSFAGMIDC
jgi:hypothetical protein